MQGCETRDWPVGCCGIGAEDSACRLSFPRIAVLLRRFRVISQVYDANGACLPGATPFACEVSVNGPFDSILSRNFFRQPRTYYQNTAVLKNIPLPREGVKLQFRAEFYNRFNHPNLYVNSGTNDVNASSFHRSGVQTIPGVTASFRDSRQIVLA